MFGFSLTCYTFIIAILNNTGKDAASAIDDKEGRIEKQKTVYLKELKDDIIAILIVGIGIFVLDLLGTAIKDINEIIAIPITAAFIIAILSVWDIVRSIFRIIEINRKLR